MIVNGYWSKRVNGTTTRVVEVADSIPTFAVGAGAGGAAAEATLVWRAARSSCSVWGPQMRPSPKVGNREERASGRLACAQCAQMGEAESVSQQEDSTGHGPRLAERAQMMLHASMKMGKTAVRSELIAHLDCRFRRKAFDAHAEEECEDTRAGACNCLVTTGDVCKLCFSDGRLLPSQVHECVVLVDTV